MFRSLAFYQSEVQHIFYGTYCFVESSKQLFFFYNNGRKNYHKRLPESVSHIYTIMVTIPHENASEELLGLQYQRVGLGHCLKIVNHIFIFCIVN